MNPDKAKRKAAERLTKKQSIKSSYPFPQQRIDIKDLQHVNFLANFNGRLRGPG